MNAAETEEGHGGPDGPETTESPEEPEEPETPEQEEEPVQEEEAEAEEPDIYEFAESSGYTAGDLQPAYESIDEDSYQIDEEAEKILIGGSDWGEIQGLLSEGEEESPEASWGDRIKSYLFDHDTEYAAGGATGIGAGILTASLGYTVAGGLMITGGSAALGLGIGSYLGDRIRYYLSDGETEEGIDEEPGEEAEREHELSEYSEWEVEIVDEEAYGEAVEEYIEQAQE